MQWLLEEEKKSNRKSYREVSIVLKFTVPNRMRLELHFCL